ncbi:MAG: COR domain-containing protein, partial [Methylococcales bacterium]
MTTQENLALVIIEREKQGKTGFLDLGNSGLTEVPEVLAGLVWLEGLVLGDEYINQDGRWVGSRNTGIPNDIATLPSWLSKLQSLHGLGIGRISLTGALDDLIPLAGLSNLRTLLCSRTQVADLSPLAGLANLQRLGFSDTPVTDLSPLAGLANLQRLDCHNTQVTDLSPLAELRNLQSLDCHNTQVTDLSPLAGLGNLQTLDCSNTQVGDLSAVSPRILAGWPVIWDASSNYHEHRINVTFCPLVIPPIEFAVEGPEAVLEYFKQLGDDSRALNESKVIFLGEGASGKTSLIKRLRNEAFDAEESQTHGIRIRKTPFEVDRESIMAHLWYFGGQEVMHATHQFFLSRRCIYVVVLNSRTDDKAEYWLKHAESFGGDSPVLVVLNKIDENPSFEFNRKVLREKYPRIRDFFRLSCRTAQGIEPFREALSLEIARSDTRRTPFPQAWLAVKNHFSEMDKDYIDADQYRQVCVDLGVDRTFSQDVLLQFLHDLGIVINFRNLKNFDTQILNPLWLTNGVYRIINSEQVAKQGGLLYECDFDAVINDLRYTNYNSGEKNFQYPLDKLNYIVRVMQEFELCFLLNEQSYVVPQLLRVEEPEFPLEGAGLRFVIRFPELLPDSILPRLMVKLHAFIKGNLRWRSGMVLHKPGVFDASARVRADREDKEISIDVCGAEPRRLLSFIRVTLKEIIQD